MVYDFYWILILQWTEFNHTDTTLDQSDDQYTTQTAYEWTYPISFPKNYLGGIYTAGTSTQVKTTSTEYYGSDNALSVSVYPSKSFGRIGCRGITNLRQSFQTTDHIMVFGV